MTNTLGNDLAGKNPGNQVDLREALYNERPIGFAHEIQVPEERITVLHGFRLDLDPKLLVPDNPIFPPAGEPRQFFENVKMTLDRHPLARHAEIRNSGIGIHANILLEPPVEIRTAAEQRTWATCVRAVQATLPSDPNAPGMTGLTRPVGSVNSKNLAVVEVIRPGEPIEPARVLDFVAELADAPFRTVALILLGAERVQPCPLCQRPGSRLDLLDRLGKCYSCGKVTLDRLYDAIFQPASHEAVTMDGPAKTEPSAKTEPKCGRKAKRSAAGGRKTLETS